MPHRSGFPGPGSAGSTRGAGVLLLAVAVFLACLPGARDARAGEAAPVAASAAGPGAGPAPEAGPAPAGGAAGPRADLIPVEVFAGHPFISRPRLSPAGDRVAAEMTINGHTVLGIVHLYDKSQPPRILPMEDVELRWYRWAGNDRLLVGAGLEGRVYGFDIYYTRLGIYDVTTGKFSIAARRREGFSGDDVIFTAEDGSYCLLSVGSFAGDNPDVYRVNLATGEMEEILASRLPVSGWYTDQAGVVRMGIGYSRGRIRFYYRSGEGDEFKAVTGPKVEEMMGAVDKIYFRRGTDQGFIVTDTRSGRFGVYEFTASTGEVGATVFEDPHVDVDDIIMSEDGNSVAGVTYADERRHVAWLDPSLKEMQEEIDAALKGRENRIFGYDRDHTRALVWTGTADDPGHYYVYSRAAGRLSRLASSAEALRGRQLSPVEPVTYRSRDGLEIPAYLTLPAGRDPHGLPLIVLPHGGPYVRDVWEYDPWVQFLANRGYVVLQPNFRGSTGYGREFLEKGFGQWGAAMQDDLVDGVRWLTGRGIVDPKRVCIMGASYGGYAALMGAIRDADVYRCAISLAGVTDLPNMMTYDRNMLFPSRYREWKGRLVGENDADLADVSPVNHAAEVRIPLLFAHGTKDPVVPYRQAEKMITALQRAKRPYEFMEFEGAGHGFSKESDSARFLAAVERFLAEHNPAN